MDTYRNFIKGEWVESSSQRSTENVNPANTEDVLGTVRLSTREEARGAVEAAAEAFRGWRATPAPARGRIVARFARLLEEAKEEVAALLTREEGKTVSESRGELQRAINVAEFCAGESRRMNGETIPSELPSNFAYTLRQPHGVVAIVTPWNFPVAIPVWKIAPALVAGNTVVFKPATNTPATAVRLVELFAEAGIPPGVLNLVLGSGSEAGDEIVSHRGGARHLVHGLERGRRRALRAGGAARRARAVRDGRQESRRRTRRRGPRARRRVHGAGRVRLDGSALHGDQPRRRRRVGRRRIRRAVLRSAPTRCASATGRAPRPRSAPSWTRASSRTSSPTWTSAREDGAELVCGGGPADGAGLRKGFFVKPTVFDRVTPEMRIAREEVFGPVLSVLRVKDFDEALLVANDSEYGLSSSIFTNDAASVFRFVEEIETGMTHVNSPTTGGEAHVPFGGIKSTGVGDLRAGLDRARLLHRAEGRLRRLHRPQARGQSLLTP